MSAYYNEFDPFAAQWIRELIKKGLIADGEVDQRDIRDIVPSDLIGFTQCHFFAGIGVWSYALRLAGWPDDRPVWTGSCPCQPFSAAGKGAGFADERHLWPAFHHLISFHKPAVVFGEQVASKDADTWLDLVQADMEEMGYAFGCVPFPSAGIGAPHIRDRAYWVANSSSSSRRERWPEHKEHSDTCGWDGSAGRCADGWLANNNNNNNKGLEGRRQPGCECAVECADGKSCVAGGLDNSTGTRRDGTLSEPERDSRNEARLRMPGEGCGSCGLEFPSSIGRQRREAPTPGYNNDGATPQWSQSEHGISEPMSHRVCEYTTSPTNGIWRDADWIFCRDGKWRPVEPGTFPLAHGAAARVGRLRGYGNAINAEQAKEFVLAYEEARQLKELMQ